MYAIVKTGGKQYKVSPGDKLSVERLDAEVGAQVELQAICVVDGTEVEADPVKAAETQVVATVLEQYRDKKVLVFKFKKRKNYKRLRGHRQNLTRIRIESVGSAVAEEKAVEEPEATGAKAAEAVEAVEAATE